jgi:hypothetical protein
MMNELDRMSDKELSECLLKILACVDGKDAAYSCGILARALSIVWTPLAMLIDKHPGEDSFNELEELLEIVREETRERIGRISVDTLGFELNQ